MEQGGVERGEGEVVGTPAAVVGDGRVRHRDGRPRRPLRR